MFAFDSLENISKAKGIKTKHWEEKGLNQTSFEIDPASQRKIESKYFSHHI